MPMKFKYLAMLAAVGLWVGQALADGSPLKEATYNEEAKVLTVSFDDGTKYEYAGVPKATYDDLQKAESKGEYFNKNIRGTYAAKKISE
jgi:lysyl-tRNA synthetase, class II